MNLDLKLIEDARRVIIQLLNIFDDILIKADVIKCRTVPSKEDRQLLRRFQDDKNLNL